MRGITAGLALLAFGLKIALALLTLGTNDVLTWEDFLAFLRAHGGIAVYQNEAGPWFFNHPPFMLHALDVLGDLSSRTGLPFPFWLRLPSILADACSLLVVAALVAARPNTARRERSRVALLLMAIAPISIMVSGFHGNTDPIMIFFVLLSIYFLDVRRNIWLAGAAFGMALNVKVVPLILAPTMAIFLWTMRPSSVWQSGSRYYARLVPMLRVGAYFAIAGTVVFAGSLPYVLQDPGAIALHVLFYASLFGNWGVPRVLNILVPDTVLPQLYLVWGRVVVLMFVVPLAHVIQRARAKPPLLLQCGVILFFFMALTPGFGIQYLAWLVPWVVALGPWPSALYFTTSGVFAFLVYNGWSHGLPWYFADARLSGWDGPVVLFELLCWASVVFIAWLMTRCALGENGSVLGRGNSPLVRTVNPNAIDTAASAAD